MRLAGAYASTTWRFARTVLPAARAELARWRARAQAIPDPALRELALAALRKRGNMEGAALFAVLAPRERRETAVRALVAFQAAYNYLDTRAEQPSSDPRANARRLHGALAHALDVDGREGGSRCSEDLAGRDGGYLMAMLDACREGLVGLPSYPLVASLAQAATSGIVAFQSLNVSDGDAEQASLERWAEGLAGAGGNLEWWELAASAGSSLPVHVLIAISAADTLDPAEVRSIERAYCSSVAALHSLLDSLIDRAEDARDGQPNLMSHYRSPAQAVARLGVLARTARSATRALEDPRHEVILTAMVCHYLSVPSARTPDALPIADSVVAGAGSAARPALSLFRAWRMASGATPAGR